MKLTPAESIALATYAKAHGRYWKQELRHAWETGDYLRSDNAGELQRFRNQHGPSRLVKVKPSDLKAVPYDNLSILPNLIAETVCSRPYTGMEWGRNASPSDVAKTEAARQTMTPQQVREFSDLCDNRCRYAYDAGVDWMLECATSGNKGRDQLYFWTSHWLSAYLKNPEAFKQRHQWTPQSMSS